MNHLKRKPKLRIVKASLVFVLGVHDVADDEETEHEACEVRNEPLGMSHDEELGQDDDEHPHGEGNLVHQFDLEIIHGDKSNWFLL